MIYYAIADLHGRFDLLEKALDVIYKDYNDRHPEVLDYTIITLGDYIDRGPNSKDIIEKLISLQDSDFISLKGNHEDMMVQAMGNPSLLSWWYSNGGVRTVGSYRDTERDVWSPSWVDLNHVKWMSNLPLFYETEKHVFVHAGVPADDLDLNDQDPEELLWMLYGKNDQGWYRGKHVVHGHHQFADGPHEWEGRTDLDTFAWKTGRLVVGVFSDEQHKALRFLEVKGDEHDVTCGEDLNDRLLLDA